MGTFTPPCLSILRLSGREGGREGVDICYSTFKIFINSKSGLSCCKTNILKYHTLFEA